MAIHFMSMAALPRRYNMKRLYIVMGVSGSGKSLIGSEVAKATGGTYIDGDDYHPKANLDKMSSGEPLTDEDRWPWLEEVVKQLVSIEGTGFVGCSALKRSYRDFITNASDEPVQFLFLTGSRELLASRMGARTGHFMPADLLDSQLDTLEVPQADEDAITVEVDATPEEIVAFIVDRIKVERPSKSKNK